MDEERYALLSAKLVAERAKVAKLEGWLKYLFSTYIRVVRTEDIDKEISDYIKNLRGE